MQANPPSTLDLEDAPAGVVTLDAGTGQVIARCADGADGRPTFLTITRLKVATTSGKGWVNVREWWHGKAGRSDTLKLS